MNETPLVLPFNRLSKNDAAIAGGKGASLGEMIQSNIPVPDGFVILADTFERFLEETDLVQEIEAILDSVDHNTIHTVENASEKIQGLILSREMPADIKTVVESEFKKLDSKYVAVRSSATAEDGAEHAWAGQLDSFLNTTENDLLEKVQRCWASLFTPRAIFYRFEKQLHTTKISVAVVVQKMVNSEKSGIAFSVHPVTEDYNQLIIEAGFGLGEAIVSGSVTPDSYVVEKEPRNILDINISDQSRALYRVEGGGNEWKELETSLGSTQVLNESQIHELSDIILRIESHYGFPCDIEWAFEANKFYIVQSRPITTLTPPPASNTIQEKKTLEQEIFPSALDMNKWTQLGRWIQKPFSSSFWAKGLTSNIAGELYPGKSFSSIFDVDGYYYVSSADLEFVKKDIVRRSKEGTLSSFNDQFTAIGNQLRSRYKALFADEEELAQMSLTEIFALHTQLVGFWFFPTYIGDVIFLAAKELNIVETEANFFDLVLSNAKRSWLELEQDSIRKQAECLISHDVTSLTATQFETILEKHLDWKTLFGEYQKQYYWLGINKWENDPQTKEELVQKINEAINNVIEKNYIEKPDSSQTDLDPVVELSVEAAYWRVTCGGLAEELAFHLRGRMTELFNQYGLTYTEGLFLTFEEVIDLEAKKDFIDVEPRTKGFITFLHAAEDRVNIRATGDTAYEYMKEQYARAPQRTDDSDLLKGVVAKKGKAVGKVCIVNSQDNFTQFKEGDILVAPETTPAFVPLMRKAAAILTERGGITSHAAIVSRELGKPCIISINGLISSLKTGDLVEVDADNGVVRILESINTKSPVLPPAAGEEIAKEYFKKDDYILSFWVQGVSIFVADVYLDVYSHLGILFIIDNGMFKQYFLKTAYEQALEDGLKFYSDEHAVKEYQKNLQSHCAGLDKFFNTKIKGYNNISKEILEEFFAYTQKLLGDYTKMNFEYTDKAFAEREKNEVIETNLSIVAKFKDEVRAVMNKTLFEDDGYLPYIWKILSQQLSVISPLLDNLTQAEILALYDGQRPDIDRVTKRQKAFVYSYQSRTSFEGKDALEIIRTFEEKVEKTNVLSGQVASKGKVKGKVKIIPVDYSDFARVNREIEKMQQGDILVAETTAPELIVACKKAGAIVTDMGGLMSHAAIVSREFRIPCVVGTKNASKILKDGDLVEVDADNGVVRKI